MTSSEPTTSFLLPLIDAMDRCVPAEYHTRILGDALRDAGLVDLPQERSEFRDFVSGSLTAVATELVGETAATDLSWTLMRQTSVRAPSSRAPGSRAPGSRAPGSRAPGSRAPGSRAPGSGSVRPRTGPARLGRTPMPTAEYTEDVFLRRVDVMVIDPEAAMIDELRIHLEARDYRVAHEDLGVTLSREAPPRLLLTNAPTDDVFSWLSSALSGFGDKAPHLIVISEEQAVPQATVAIDRVLPAEPLAPIVTAISEILGEPG